MGKEARYDSDGNLDEVVADDVSSFHLESLDTGAWWIGLTHQDGTVTHINLYAKNSSRTIVQGRCDFDC